MARRYDTNDATDRTTGLREAASAVRRGELVVLPTDTVYGSRRRRVQHRGAWATCWRPRGAGATCPSRL